MAIALLINPFAGIDFGLLQVQTAQAQGNQNASEKSPGIITVLVQEELMDEIAMKAAITGYAYNAQKRIPFSRAFILTVEKDQSPFEIATVLEQIYFQGIDPDIIDNNPFNNLGSSKQDNRLMGVVLIGDIPLPVVTEEEKGLPSVLPYTDFDEKGYIFNHETQLFEKNDDVTKVLPEIWHGVIRSTQSDPELAKTELFEFFEKNQAYSDGDPDYTDFNRRILYADFPAIEEQMNYMDFRNYERYSKYMEEMNFKRFNKYLLGEIVDEVSADMGSDVPIISEETLAITPDISTELSIREYVKPFMEAMQVYLGKVNETIEETGRWDTNRMDTLIGLISMRDKYAETELLAKQLRLEKAIDEVVKANNENITLPAQIEMTVKLTIAGVTEREETFLLPTFIDGQMINEIDSAEQCGFHLGQKRQEGQTILENNSVFVEANPLNNPYTIIKPPDNSEEEWKIKEDSRYTNNGGCLFNNFTELDTDGNGDPNLGPQFCQPNAAHIPLFDVIGSKELEEVPVPEQNGGRCNIDRISFLPANYNVFNERMLNPLWAVEVAGDILNALGLVDPEIYNPPIWKIIQGIHGELPGANANLSTQEKLTELAFLFSEGAEILTYSTNELVEIELWMENFQTKEIDSAISHIEPSTKNMETLKGKGEPSIDPTTGAPKINMSTHSIPADGIRYIHFVIDGQEKQYVYPNLFKIKGETDQEVRQNFLQTMAQKQVELRQQIGFETDVITDFFTDPENIMIIEALTWANTREDQKLERIIEKYTNRDSFMPTPFSTITQLPQQKPDGYEVLHIVAEGDSQGYEFGLKNALLPEINKNKLKEESEIEPEEIEVSEEELFLTEGEAEGVSSSSGGSGGAGSSNGDGGQIFDAPSDHICGDLVNGVEIWEWFASLQCWLEEEILPGDELIELDYSYSELPEVIYDIEEEDRSINVLDQVDPTVNEWRVTINKRDLIPNQIQELQIEALDESGEPIFDYINSPINLSLSDSQMGTFDQNDFNVVGGEETIMLTAVNPGSGTLTIQPEGYEAITVDLDVKNEIDVQWSSVEVVENGIARFEINLELRDQNGEPVTDVNDILFVGPEKPADGGFVQNGQVELVDGKGSTTFFPIPGKDSIKLISKDPYYKGEHVINPSPPQASEIKFEQEQSLHLDETVQINVKATDSLGFVDENYNNNATVTITNRATEAMQEINVELTQGMGSFDLLSDRETGILNLKAESEGIEGEGEVNILGEVTSEDLENQFPQALFVSLVGFPAGNVFEENYFGGKYLFNGKAQAVFSFLETGNTIPTLTISPQYKINLTQPSQKVYVEALGNRLLLQAFDQKELRTLLTKEIPIEFSSVIAWNEEDLFEQNTAYILLNDDSYQLKTLENGLEILNTSNQKILTVKEDLFELFDPRFNLDYNDQSQFDLVELELRDEREDLVATLFLNLSPENFSENSFDELDPNLTGKVIFGGNSTQDAKGFMLFNPENQEEETFEEFYGIKGENPYISHFTSGMPIGEATRLNLCTTCILLGDPTVSLENKSTSNLNFDYSMGQKVYEDANSSNVVSMIPFDFDNDGDKDVGLVTQDGRVRLLETGQSAPIIRDIGDIAYLADGTVSIESFDFEDDGYEDLVVATEEGRLAILHNNEGVISRSNQALNIGKQLYSIKKGDMNQDGSPDIVALDSRGDVIIFLYDSNQKAFEKQGQVVDNFGFSLTVDQNLSRDLKIRYSGISEPVDPSEALSEGLDSEDLFELQNAQAESARENPAAAAQIPTLPWPEGEENNTYFEAVDNLGFLTVNKSVENVDRPGEKNLDLGEKVRYSLQITSNQFLDNVVIADTIPDALELDAESVSCVSGCEQVETAVSDVYLFMSDLTISAGQTIEISYEVSAVHTPQAAIELQTLSTPVFLADEFPDILVSPPYNPTNHLIQLYSTGPGTYSKRTTEDDGMEDTDAVEITSLISDSTNSLDGLTLDEDSDATQAPVIPGTEEAIEEVTGKADCFESPDSAISCTSAALDKVAEGLSQFNCSGGGCFPMPWNKAFLVPPDFPVPLFAFPTTLPTPIGPMPFIWPGSPIGAANIPGPIMSMIRFYLSPTLTGGMAISMCWGPYNGFTPPPPPSIPIPYPPPAGNCIVKALPTSALPWGGVCKQLEESMSKLTQVVNSGVSKIDTAITNGVNNNPAVPLDLTQANSQQGAGGLEVSLGINLGNAMTYEPPIKGFSNIHLPTFDAALGKLSGWMDRQMLEISNKLFRLPTISIYLPDTKTLFTNNFRQFERQALAWADTLEKSTQATFVGIDGEKSVLEKASDSGKPNIQESLDTLQAVQTQANIYNLNAIQGLYDVASTMPILNITETEVVFEVPWMSAAEIQAFITNLELWLIYYEKEIARVKDKWEAISCPGQTGGERATTSNYSETAIDEALAAECEANPQKCATQQMRENTREDVKAKAVTACIARQIGDRFLVDFNEVRQSVQENIQVLQSYLDQPKKLIKYKGQLAAYLYGVAGHIDTIAQLMGGWHATIREQLISWAELGLTIKEIVENFQNIFEVFTNFDQSCATCSNDRFSNFGYWTLLGVILPELPILTFPRLPDIVLDLSNLDLQMNIELPVISIQARNIPLPPLPYVRLPDFPDVNLLLQVPPLPILPRLPDPPDLPDMPPLPVVDLPTLPPPPKLPDLGKSFEVIVPLIEQVLNIWCLAKKGLAPVPESNLGAQISLLTNRPAYLTPLDLLQAQAPNITAFDLGFSELRVETTRHLGYRFEVLPDALQEASEQWNSVIRKIPETYEKAYTIQQVLVEDFIQEVLDESAGFLGDKLEDFEENANQALNLNNSALGEALIDADEWLRDREAALEEAARSLDLDLTYEQYVKGIQSLNKKIAEQSEDVKDRLRSWMEENNQILDAITVAMFLGIKTFDSEEVDDVLQIILQETNDVLGSAAVAGPVVTYQLLDFIKACFQNRDECENSDDYIGQLPVEQEIENQISEMAFIPEVITENQIVNPEPLSSIQMPLQNSVQISSEDQIQTLVTTLINEFNKVNSAETVDYQVLKEQFGVEDVQLREHPDNTVNRMEEMIASLYEQSQELENEVIALENEVDPYVFANVGPRPDRPYELASNDEIATESEDGLGIWGPFITEVEAFESITADIPETEIKALGELAPPAAASGPCTAGICLPDPITNSGIPVVPVINQIIQSETIFLPSGHIVYSDGDKVFLKEDLVEKNQKQVEDATVKQLSLNKDFLETIGQSSDVMGAVNMLQSTLTEDGSGSFKWHGVTNPELYGYGIDIKPSIQGWRNGNQNKAHPEVALVLLPKNEDGSLPEIVAGNQNLPYDSLITSLPQDTEDEEVERIFGIKSSNIVKGQEKVIFPSINGAEIILSDQKAVYVKVLEGESTNLKMENGFYQIRARWFTQDARVSTAGSTQLLAPQSYGDAAPPIDLGEEVFYTPVYKEKQIQATELLFDLSGSYEYAWYAELEADQITPFEGDTLNLPAQTEPKMIPVTLVASQDLEDNRFEPFEKTFTINVYAPPITLDGDKLKDGVVQGQLENIPEAPEDDLSDIPFSIFRKRWNTWKNIGQISQQNSTPASNSLNSETGSYQTLDRQGNYEVKNWIIDQPSPVILKDANAELIARVNPITGQIEVFQENYFLKALPATTEYPTRIGILDRQSQQVAGNVYYMALGESDIQIVQGGIVGNELNQEGVTVADVRPGDDIIAKNIPEEGPSFPGGVAIFNNTPPQKNIALIDKDGSIRMMQEGYDLKIKDQLTGEDHYIFELIEVGGSTLFEIFIDADFDELSIATDETMDNSGIQVGLNPVPSQTFASFTPVPEIEEQLIQIAQASEDSRILPNLPSQSSASQEQDLPFPDLDENHPYYDSIVSLYDNHVIEGFGDGTFRPNEKITRAEFTKILLGGTQCFDCTLPSEEQKAQYTQAPFFDTTLPAWYFYCVSIAKELGIVTGYGDGSFKPNQNISRAEGAAAVIREGGIPLQEAPDEFFIDVPDYAWYKDHVYTAVQVGLIPNNNGVVNPDEQITRGEFTFMVDFIRTQECKEVDSDRDGIPDILDPEPFISADLCPCSDNPNQDDSDGDGKRDVCDEDIDGDGITHPICTLFDDEGNLIEDQMIALQKTPNMDNCIFEANAGQEDSDENGIGDVCELEDKCPAVPEDLDGVNDNDGCPELEDNFGEKSPGIYVNKGPLCQLIDYEAELMDGDTIMTAITDLNNPIQPVIYSQSSEAAY